MKNKDTLSEFKLNLIGIIGKILINGLFLSTDIKVKGYDNIRHIIESHRLIFATWHSRMLIYPYLYQGINGAALVSQHKDGEIATRIIEKMGIEGFRGSTTKGGVRALVKMIKALKEEDRMSLITTDGPKGPRFTVQPGIISLARKTGYPIIPTIYSAKKIKIFSSWDRFILPFPFTVCRVSYGDPMYIPKQTSKDEEKQHVDILEQTLRRLTVENDAYFGHEIVST